MKLINCHIDGFGKLIDCDLDFSSGLNVFCHGNGWGKSTIAAFLRVMLYGFAGEGKRNDLENERRKYVPWSGNAYGGSLTFAVGDRRYVVYRSFGAKAKDDTFKLFDAATNLPSRDYSESLGEELFGIDHASFRRTAFTDQQDLETGGTDSISAKMSKLCEDTDDLNNYENVTAFLNKSLNNMSPNRVTGSINALMSEISALKADIMKAEPLEGTINELTLTLRDRRASGDAFATEIKKLRETEKLLIKQENRRLLRGRREELLKDKEHREEAYRLIRATVPGHVPTEEEIEESRKTLRHLRNMELQLAEKKVSDEELRLVEKLDETFSNGIPEEEELLRAEQVLREYKESEKSLEALEGELKTEQEKYAADLRDMGIRLKRIHLRRVYAVLIFLVYIVSEAIVFINRKRIPEGIFLPLVLGILAVGIISLTVFFIVLEINYKKASKVPSSEKRDHKESEVLDVRGRLEMDRRKLNDFFAGYNVSCEPGAYAVVLNALRHDKEVYLQISDKVTYAEKSGILGEKQGAEGRLREFLEATGIACTGDYQNDLQNLSIIVRELSAAEKELELSEQRLRDFLKENEDYESFSEEQPETAEMTVSEVRERIERLEENLKENDKYIKQEEKRREGLLEELLELNEKKEELSESLERLESLKKKYSTFEATLKLLQQAHDELNSKLLAPLSDSFRTYLEDMGYTLSGNNTDKVYVDSRAEVTIEEAGGRHELKFFSAGTRDLMAVAMRMALLDNMYEGEKPFVVLDDPFVNLDTEKAGVAREFLEKISKDYQVLYFTCHSEFV